MMNIGMVRHVFLVLQAIALAACSSGNDGPGNRPHPPSNCVDRAELCADLLLGTDTGPLVDNRFYVPLPGAVAALHDFEGTLETTAAVMTIAPGETSGRSLFPALAVEFIIVGDILLPLQREVISGGSNAAWDIILSPGTVWSETNDQGMSRASLPFTLVSNQWNEAHNGVATFLFDDLQVSRLHFQVTQETALWNKVDMHGSAVASYTPGPIANAAQVEQDFIGELGDRVEVHDWAELGTDYPGADLSVFDRNIATQDVSAAGLLVDNTLYFRGANTRFGAYPYPLEMRHGVFSVTKSSQTAMTLLRLAEMYGDQVFDLFVTDYLNVTAAHSGWNGVTFGNLLTMTAGIGDRNPDPAAQVTFADENDPDSQLWNRIWSTYPKDNKLAEAFKYGDYPWAPGQIVRYNTAHTYILGAAMHSFYASMEGPGANVWEMMKREVYEPIGIRAVPTMKTVDNDPIPLYGFGLFLNAFDVARISQLLNNDGSFGGQQLLHRDRTREALYKSPDNGFPTFAGVPMLSGNQLARYLHSFWSFQLTGPGSCTVRAPYMWGFGGNFVVILPNGVSAFRFADGDVHDPAALVLGTDDIRPFC